MSLSINQVIDAQIMPQAMSAQRRDLSMVAIFTPDIGEAFMDDATRFVTVGSANDVANLFGTNSETHKSAQALFSVRPTPRRATIARWAKTKQEIPATANAIKGSTMSVGINTLKQIEDGSMALPIGSELVTLTGLNFSSAIDMEDVATLLTERLTDKNLTVEWDNVGIRFIIQANAAGAIAATKLGYATEAEEGFYVGSMLKLEDGQATLVVGRAATSVEAESLSEAMTALENVNQNWYGVGVADAITDEQLDDAHTWITSSSTAKVMAYTAIRESQLEWNASNILKKLHDKNSGRLMVQFNKTGDDYAAITLLGIALSTNWNAINSAKTVKFKQQVNVQSDDRVTLNEASKAQRLGVNFYTDYDGISMLAEGVMLGGIFIDEVVGLDAFLDACQKQAFTTLQANPTKIPQTDKGQAMLIGSLVVIGEEFVRNGFLAGGVWRGNDVGELTYGDRLEAGYYFYSDSYDFQSIADREARKAMPIMCAIKLSGAIHTADLLIQFNR